MSFSDTLHKMLSSMRHFVRRGDIAEGLARLGVALGLLMTAYLIKYSDPDCGILEAFLTGMESES